MKETMGQIIRRLRKERGLTQEELAEQLGVTFQAVSKWENDTGMPDISQVVPLSHFFGVPTDVLFGVCGSDNMEEIIKIIEKARSMIPQPATIETAKAAYDYLLNSLRLYPSNEYLLKECLSIGMLLAYPEDNDCYDKENAESIYRRCVSQADLIIKYAKDVNNIMRTHQIMAIMHAVHGDYAAAYSHAEKFPWRPDFTIHNARAIIAHYEKDYASECVWYQTDFGYHLEALLNAITWISKCYYRLEKYGIAIECLNQALAFISVIIKDEVVIPWFHIREAGDIHLLLAKAYLKQGKVEEALSELKKMVDYDTIERPKLMCAKEKKLNTPLLRDAASLDYFWNGGDCFKKNLLKKLNDYELDVIRDTPEFQELLQKAEKTN